MKKVFQDDFSTDLNKWLNISGTWELSNNKMSLKTGVSSGYSYMISNSPILDSYQLSFSSSVTAHIVLKWNNVNSNVIYRFNVSSISKHLNGLSTTMQTFPHPYGNTNINVVVSVNQNMATIKVNGNVVVENDDLANIPNGVFGFAGYNTNINPNFSNVELFHEETKVLLSSQTGELKTIKKQVPSTKNEIPIMTSNTNPSGIANSSSNFGTSFYPFKAFDGVKDNSWTSANGVVQGWVSYNFLSPTMISNYSILARQAVLSSAPKDWTFEGSDDEVNWTILDTRTNQTYWAINQYNTYKVTSPRSFKSYRLNITANNGNTSYVAVGKLEMHKNKTGQLIQNIASNSKDNFINYGIPTSDLDELMLSAPLEGYANVQRTSTPLENGKLFIQPVSTQDIKTIKF